MVACILIPEWARGGSKARVLDKVRAFYGKAREISACFEQTARSKFDPGASTKVKGCLYIRRPDKFRWEYDDPESGPLLVWDGKDLYQYDSVDETVEVIRGFGSNNLTVALSFLFGKGDIRSEFAVESASEPKQGRVKVVLRPKKKPSRFKELVLVVDADTGEVEETSWTDSYGGENRLVFKGFKLNPGLEDDKFRFVIPKGVDVIEQGTPR